MNFRTRALFIACLCLFPSAAMTQTFYVDREAPGASDSNNGLSPLYTGGNNGPWLTVTKAGQVADAGATVFVYGGDYRNDVTGYGVGVVPIERSGNPLAPIRFAAAPGEKPILNTLLVRDRQWIEVIGFTFISRDFTLPPNWQDMPAIVVDDPTVIIDPNEPWSTREASVRQKYATYMAVRDFFMTTYTNGIDIKNSSHVVVQRNTFSLYAFGIQVRDKSTDILIEQNHFSYCQDGVFTWKPAPSISDSIIRRNVVRQSFNNGMMVREDCSDVLVEANDVRYSGTSHISMLSGCQNSILRSNRGEFGGYYSETMEFPGSSAINVHTSRFGIVVERNYAAYQVDLTGNDGNGLMADLMLNGAGVLFRNNVSLRNMGSGLRTVDSPNCVILNNTLLQNGYLSPDPRVGAGVYLARSLDLNQTVANNLFYDNAACGIKSYFTIDQQTAIDHNLYFSPGGAPFIWDGYAIGELAYYTLGQIRQNTPWETNGVAGDPLFPNRRYQLAPQSPAVDSGMTTLLVPNDFSGQPRPLGAGYDIGAFESH